MGERPAIGEKTESIEVIKKIEGGDEIPQFPEAPPIPGTVDQRTKASGSEEFNFGQAKESPAGFLQIACVYPEGMEKDGQQFLSRLRTMGAKMAQTLTLEAVYIQPWKPDQMDIRAWCRAARLAGAHVIFIMVPKKEKGLFSRVSVLANEETLKSRLVLIEQVAVRTLYADILDQMKKLAYGKD